MITRAELIEAVRAIDSAVAATAGRGFEATPFTPSPELAAAVGLGPDTELWVKDETGNVSGSHKGRHLFGVALAHRLAGRVGDAPYAIASCGNAALAAAVLARATDHPLDVYVPTWANPAVVDRITELGARVVYCPRSEGVLGDPAHQAMKAAVEAGAVPFSCQGTETPTTIDGARTLAYEMADTLIATDARDPARLDRVFVQVGGGALATGLVTGLGGLDLRPVIHAVQPAGNHPLIRAWDRVTAESTGLGSPATNSARAEMAGHIGPMDNESARSVTQRLAANPERYMTPWEHEPASYATGILDDVTYDWLAIIEAMLASGGHPVVADEDDLRRAHRLAHLHTDMAVCPTGAAGLGGLLALVGTEGGTGGTVCAGERVAVLFTGRMRPGDPDPRADRPETPSPSGQLEG